MDGIVRTWERSPSLIQGLYHVLLLLMSRSGFFVTFIGLLALGACSQQPNVVPTRVGEFRPWSDAVPAHRLMAGDEIDLVFLLNSELNQTKLVVGPDGRVTVPLLGSMWAGGKSVNDFRDELEAGYASRLRVAQLDVLVRTYGSSRIYVGGEVRTQGAIPLQGPINALQGVLMAGGILPTARMDEVILIRRDADGRPMLRTIDLKRYAGSADPTDDVPLLASDVLYVPKTDIAAFDVFIDQYLNQALPFTKSLNYNLGSGAAFF